jgi:hypothetical protein
MALADFPYAQNAASLKKFLTVHIPSAGVPPKVTHQYLEAVGFKSSNDRSIIRVLRAIGLVEESGVPTASWQQMRDRNRAGTVMAKAVSLAYAPLFATFPNAQDKDPESLKGWFSANTKHGQSALRLIVSTFKALCDVADFGPQTEGAAVPSNVSELRTPVGVPAAVASSSAMVIPSININIQLHLPATDDSAVWESLFASMKKHLLSADA